VQALQRQQPKDSHAGYVRGLLFGIGAAIVGMIFYAGFTIVTGIYIGYVSLRRHDPATMARDRTAAGSKTISYELQHQISPFTFLHVWGKLLGAANLV